MKHPLVTFLLRHKWRHYGRYVYYASFTFYMIFLLFLTGYALVTNEKYPPGKCTAPRCNCSSFQGIDHNDAFESFLINFGRLVILVLACFVLILKVQNVRYFYFYYVTFTGESDLVLFVCVYIHIGKANNMPGRAGDRIYVFWNVSLRLG